MNNLMIYNNPVLLQNFIFQTIKDLPKESIDEILSFLLYIKKKYLQPEMFNLEYELLNDELRLNSISEMQHLENEFFNYKEK